VARLEIGMDQAVVIEQLASREKFLKVPELAGLLQFSSRTIYRRVRASAIPFTKIGTCLRFDPAEIAEWLRSEAVRKRKIPSTR